MFRDELTLIRYCVYSASDNFVDAARLPALILAEPLEHAMTKPRIRRRAVRTAASVIRTFDLEHRAQPQALLDRLEDKDLFVRQIASVALARMAELHPDRLLRGLDRVRKSLKDDSAYVRWHVVYALGTIIASSPSRRPMPLDDLVGRLDDENRIVRLFARKALLHIAARHPAIVQKFVRDGDIASRKHAIAALPATLS